MRGCLGNSRKVGVGMSKLVQLQNHCLSRALEELREAKVFVEAGYDLFQAVHKWAGEDNYDPNHAQEVKKRCKAYANALRERDKQIEDMEKTNG